MPNLANWMRSGEYLPHFMRDFHDQKDLFKAIHDRIDVPVNNRELADVDWRKGQCYVIDIFLWFMAKRGYTLQRSRKKLDFADIEFDVDESRQIRNDHFAQMLRDRNNPEPADANG